MAKAFYNGTQAELADGAQNLVEIVTTAPATYGLTAGQVTSYTALVTNFVNLLALATEPATRTTVAVANKNAAMKLLQAATVDVARIIAATPTVTNGQLLALRLNPRLLPQPAPVPLGPPAVDVMTVTGRVAKFRIHDNESESKRAKAAGAIGANVYTYVGPAAPTDPTEYFFQGMTTRTITQVQFPNSVPSGATVWVTCNWVGSRGQIGNGSTPISFTLQGGAVGAAV
ncbi:MAG TPA: hypothetical protein VK324_17735 [Tepidisphaeraceae bacterium]|nr:hypothetical protein [Tepidisphaeraceae bacterium]